VRVPAGPALALWELTFTENHSIVGHMATHKSAEKRARQSVKRYQRNKSYKTRMRTLLKDLRALAATGIKDKVKQQLPMATSLIHKLVEKGIIHRNTGNRYLSHLSRLVH
jgi:small subunit ribosomal protein S20